MSKGLRTAAIIVGAVALIATGVGAFAGTAAGASVFGSYTAGVIAGYASSVAAVASVSAAALSIGAQLTAQPPPLGGSATKFKADKDAGLPYVIGRTATGGNIIYRRTHNTAGYSLPDLQTFVVLLSCAGPINAIESFSADKVPVSFSAGNATGTYSSWMFQTQQLGQSPESAALRVTPGGTLPPGWTSAAKMSGLAAAMWTLRYDQKGKFYAQGVPQPLWVLQGAMVYDPRLDSTYPGGSGACRSNDETTFVYSENPYLHGLTWALGRYQNGKRVCGIGAPIAGIDVRAYVEGANVADANGWKVGGTVYTTDRKWAVLKAMLQAGGGRPMHLGAMLSCTVQTPRVALATVTTDDLIGEAVVPATTSRRDRINSIIPRYRSEAHGWEVIPAAPVTVSAYVTADGGLRTRERDYSLVQDLDQASALAAYDIVDAREFGPVVLPLKLRWLGYRPGDCIAVNLPEVGLNGQDIVIGNREFDPAGLRVTLTATSETFAKHAFALGRTGTAPPTPGVGTAPVAPQPAIGAWSLSGAGLAVGSNVTPALIITGAAASTPIDAVVIEYRLYVPGQADDAGWIGGGSYLPDVARVELTAVQPGTAYDVAVSYRLGAFTGPRRILAPVTTTAVALLATRNIDPQNLFRDPLEARDWWASNGSVSLQNPADLAPVGLRWQGDGQASYQNPVGGQLPIRSGEQCWLEFRFRSNSDMASSGTLAATLNVYDAAGNYINTLVLPGVSSLNRAAYPVDGNYDIKAAVTLPALVAHFSTGVNTPIASVLPIWGVTGYSSGFGHLINRPYCGRFERGATYGATLRQMPVSYGGGAQFIYSSEPLTFDNVAGVGEINVASHDVYDPEGTVSYAVASISGLTPGMRYAVYDDDPTRAGGTRTYGVTTYMPDLIAQPGRRWLGSGTIPATVGGSVVGDPGNQGKPRKGGEAIV